MTFFPTGIVVTSLDDSDGEPDESEPASDVCISPALLEEMKRRQIRSPLPLQPSECQALVLYRPLVPPTTEGDAAENVPPPAVDDAMDVEP